MTQIQRGDPVEETILVDLLQRAQDGCDPAAFDGLYLLFADRVFRELVLFTPPHRQSVAIEPYTCSADAQNLANRGIDSGWQVIPPGGAWDAVVEYRWALNR